MVWCSGHYILPDKIFNFYIYRRPFSAFLRYKTEAFSQVQIRKITSFSDDFFGYFTIIYVHTHIHTYKRCMYTVIKNHIDSGMPGC